MTIWSEFFDLLSPDLPDCPQVAQETALRRSAIAFCEQSLAWKYDHPDIAVTVATDEYFFDPPVGSVVHAINYAEFNDTQIESNIREDDVRIWDWRHQTGVPAYAIGGPTSVTLIPVPNLEGTLKLTVILKPSPVADGIDDDMYNEYRETIVHGAKAILMLSPKKPYTDGVLAAYHHQQFTIGAGQAGQRVARSYTRTPLQTKIMNRRPWP